MLTAAKTFQTILISVVSIIGKIFGKRNVDKNITNNSHSKFKKFVKLFSIRKLTSKVSSI